MATENHKMEGFQNIQVVHITTWEVPQIRQQYEAETRAKNRTYIDKLEKLERNGLSSDIRDDKPRRERLEMSKITNKPSQIQRMTNYKQALSIFYHD